MTHCQLLICLLVCRCWRIFSTCWWSLWGSSAAFVPLDQSAVGGFPSCTRSLTVNRWVILDLDFMLRHQQRNNKGIYGPTTFFVVYLKFTFLSLLPVAKPDPDTGHMCAIGRNGTHKLAVPWWCPAMIANHSLARGWSSKMPGNFQVDGQEKIYPIHVAAKLGKCDILRIRGGNWCSDFRNIAHQ